MLNWNLTASGSANWKVGVEETWILYLPKIAGS